MILEKGPSFRLSTESEGPGAEATDSFRGPSFHLHLYSSGNWTVFEDESSVVALSGEVYWDYEEITAERLAERLRGRDEIPLALDGSFILLLIDRTAGKCRVCIDRTASKKVFYRNEGPAWSFSDSLSSIAGKKPSVNPGAFAAYLLNGIPLDGLTLFQGVKSLPAATSATLSAQGCALRSYWSYEIDSAFQGRSEKKLVAEFGELLLSGISARLRHDSRPVFLSLSGGYDSTCILASALRVVGAKNLRSFSYQSTDGQASDADARIAAEVSRTWNVEHQTIDIPRFPLARIVEGNARAALSTANPCLELGVWETLDQTLGFTSGAARLFFGDNAFGHDPNWRLSTYADALAWLPMPDVAGFDQLRPFLSSDHFERTKLSYAEIFETLLQKGPASRSPVDVKDFFYFDQRVAYALMPWRDRFCGRHGQPVNPLLDARVLDFYRHVPAEYRRRRRLYRQTVETLYPEFFKRKRATSTGSTIVPRSLLQEDPSWVQGQIQSLHPALSELVSATSIGGLWPGLSAPASAAKTGMKARARKLLKNTWLGEAVRGYFPRSSAIPRDVILLRLLIADASVKMVVGCD